MDSYVTTDQLYNSLRELVSDLQPLPLHYNVTVDFPPEPLWFIGVALILVFIAVLWNTSVKKRGGRHAHRR